MPSLPFRFSKNLHKNFYRKSRALTQNFKQQTLHSRICNPKTRNSNSQGSQIASIELQINFVLTLSFVHSTEKFRDRNELLG